MANRHKNTVDERPSYLSEDGSIDLSKVWQYQPKQLEPLRDITVNGQTYRTLAAPQFLSVGGFRGGKTTGALMFGIENFCLKYRYCDILVLRRTFKELESGAIADLKTFVPKELYNYDATKHVATFTNGSRVVFGHCANNLEKDIAQYLGQAYPFILIDECAQFSADAWQMLHARNMVNASCEPDEFGRVPDAVMWGCTNPLGPHWSFYYTVFVLKEPWQKPETAIKDNNGDWWEKENGEYKLIHNLDHYAYQQSTVLDNPKFIARNPGYVAKLMAMPKAKRDKYLYGVLDKVEGQYYDCWSTEFHVINLRDDPEAIIWEDWQPVWIGQDWGMQHANAAYFFTKAMVKNPLTGKYKLKTVCFQEVLVTGGKTYKNLASILATKARRPDGKIVKVKNLYFSHEKFSRVMDKHTPAEDYSRELKTYGLPGVTRGTTNRIASASFIYNQLKEGDLVITDNCVEIINAIPRLMRNPDNLDDVLKTSATSDDAYDGFRLGLYGELGAKNRPADDRIMERAKTLQETDPIAAHFYLMKQRAELAKRKSEWIEQKGGVLQLGGWQ